MGKRNSGEGSFYHEEARNIWVYEYSYHDTEGRRRRKKFAGKTKRIAMQKAKTFSDALKRSKQPKVEVITVSDWLHECMTTMVKPRIRARTYEKYVSSLKNYVLPAFGKTALTELDAAALQRHFNGLLSHGGLKGTGISSSTVRAARRYFSMCLDEAVRAGKLDSNPVKRTRPPKLEKKEIVVLTNTEVDRLIDAALEIEHPYMGRMMSELIALTAHTGLRQGEVFGLKWEDIDLDQAALHVRRSLAHVVGEGAVFQEPKTKKSRRNVALMPKDVEELRSYQVWQKEYAESLGNMFHWQDLVFTSPFGDPLSPTNFARRYFHPLLKKCNIREGFTFHGLRHTHATLLLQQGVNPKVVQERLGHSSIKVTMDTYSHVLPDMQRPAVDALNKIFKETFAVYGIFNIVTTCWSTDETC